MAEDWAAYIKSFISDGVRNGGTNLQITENSGMSVRMDTGTACLAGYIFISKEDLEGRYHPLYLQAAHPTLPRIDRIVLRLDRSIAVRSVTPCVLLGTAAASPVPKSLTRNDSVYEISLAQVRVEGGAVSIASGKITDERFNESVCGLMHSILGLDSSEWQRQFDAFLAAVGEQDDAFLSEQAAKFNQQRMGYQDEFDLQLGKQLEEQNAFKLEERAWFSSVQNELPKYAGFNFDNQWLYPGTTKETDISTLAASLKLTKSGDIQAYSGFTVNPDGSLTETMTVYADDKRTVLWQRTRTTSFGDTIREVVS